MRIRIVGYHPVSLSGFAGLFWLKPPSPAQLMVFDAAEAKIARIKTSLRTIPKLIRYIKDRIKRSWLDDYPETWPGFDFLMIASN